MEANACGGSFQTMQYMKSFTYLVSTVNSYASLGDEIINCMAKTSIAFDKLHHRLWGQSDVKLDTKIQVYKAVILSFLLYGS